jgi:hypothetical protein
MQISVQKLIYTNKVYILLVKFYFLTHLKNWSISILTLDLRFESYNSYILQFRLIIPVKTKIYKLTIFHNTHLSYNSKSDLKAIASEIR